MMIDTRGVRTSFGDHVVRDHVVRDHVVLDGIDLDVAAGTLCALLGPKGAGQTTTGQILSTLIRADGGAARVAGHDVAREPDAARAVIGVTRQFSAVDNLLTGEEHLLLIADLLHMRRREARQRAAAALLDRFELTGAARRLPYTAAGLKSLGADLSNVTVE